MKHEFYDVEADGGIGSSDVASADNWAGVALILGLIAIIFGSLVLVAIFAPGQL